jgi:hypothetical protein
MYDLEAVLAWGERRAKRQRKDNRNCDKVFNRGRRH